MESSLKKRLAENLKKQKVVFAYLFGSQAMGTAGRLSDTDVAVYLDDRIPRDKHFDARLEVLGALMDVLKTDDIDVAVLNDAPPLLAHRILKEGVLIFSDNDKVRLAYEVRAVLKYLDWKPYLDKFTQQVFGTGAADGG
jgi:predicted nucleotidyltransferase